MAKNQYVSGVGGWLRLLIVGLMVLGPLMGLGSLANEFHDAEKQFPQVVTNIQWSIYKLTSWLIFATLAAISFSAGYRLWQIHSSESVRFAILALWLAGPVGNLLYVVSALVIFGAQLGGNGLANMTGGLIGSCVAAGIWTAYLKRSVRVRNTYNLLEAAAAAESADRPSQLQSSENQTTNWWRRRSKGFRLWCFSSFTWAAAVFLLVLAIEPYGSYMEDEEYFNMLLIMFMPPLFIGAAKYAYEKWVK